MDLMSRGDEHVERVVGAGNVVDDDVVNLHSISDDSGDDPGIENLSPSELEEKRAVGGRE